MDLELKKLSETDKEIYYEYSDNAYLKDKKTNKFILDNDGDIREVKIKGGILKFIKGSLSGIDGNQLIEDMLFVPLNLIEYNVINRKYLQKAIREITKEYEKTNEYLKEGIFFVKDQGSVYLQDIETEDQYFDISNKYLEK